jgi:TolA-binding protein
MDSTLKNEEPALGDGQLSRLEEELSKFRHNAARHLSDPQTRMNTFRLGVLGAWPSLGRRALRSFSGLLLAACIGVAAVAWWQSSNGYAAKTAPPQPAPLDRTAPEDVAPTAAALSPELTQLLQSMARDLASVGQEIERLKASQQQMARDNANVAEQLKANQEQIARSIANVAEQLRVGQEQMAREIATDSEQNLPPKISAPPARSTATPTRKPVPTLPSAQATAQPQAKKPLVSSVPRPTPVR